MRALPMSTSTRAPTVDAPRGSLVVSELETTARRLALEASVATVEGVTLEAMEGTVALVVALVATSTAMMAMEEITATLVVWIGGATSHHRNRLPCQPTPMETTC